MNSVVVRRDLDGRPVWQCDYAEFMGCVGFRTRLCKPRHPFTKGKVERRDCRVSRDGRYLHICSDDLSRELVAHAVTWDRRDSWCEGQWADAQPEEL